MAELQTIPARHGVATFVPAGQIIKIINTSGTQVIDTWAFALPTPEVKPENKKKEEKDSKEEGDKTESKPQSKPEEKDAVKPTPKKKKDADLPSQEDAEKATQELMKQGDQAKGGAKDGKESTPQKSTWSSYVPTLGLTSSSKKAAPKKEETEQQKNSRTWASYFPSGKGFSTYIPKSASDTVSAFASDHQRDTNKSYIEQLQDFSKTPVGAAGLAAVTGSGYAGSLYAGYQAWNSHHAADAPPMEFMSMPHSRSASLHMRPKVNDTMISNLREPMLTLIEDTSPGIHDTLIAACDPQRYKGLGVQDWEHHGSCAENLVLALKELNERAGLKGAKSVGADVTINAVPAPLNLFMNIPWDDDGDLAFKAPKGKEGDYVRLKAERDVVVVMSACPQDVLEINAKKPTDAQFIVEGGDEETKEQPKKAPARRPPPKKLNSSSRAPSTAGTDAGDAKPATKRPVPARRTVPQKKPDGATAAPAAKKPVPKPVQPQKKVPAEGGEANGEAAAPVEKKKPRKLTTKPKAEAGGE
ncbi:hypothetical protein BAUCODRAFT_129775 [Baudoinia panamericana UAMH 10762]|uniref:DUF1989 domain-containing protein n=1 Tax=Baudoinia panamericana (strain UAMH 10762) TaxID=717646 RepID=M2NFI5_BAUPA|nr:uncharacterized protein BAUCODRAFT_129775 [Baudoinia panamericana UAMH 10762]EMC97989.1 hypothetical protein BAUCODRAFT_129775 [Baudoinia panamericana UAMH 10762]